MIKRTLAIAAGTTALGAILAIGAAKADLLITNTAVSDEKTITDTGGCAGSPGGCIPIGTTGYVANDTAPDLVVGVTGYYQFTYLGAGDSTDDNMFTVTGANGSGTFCSQAFAGCNGGNISHVGDTFTLLLDAGDMVFQYAASVENGTCSVNNSAFATTNETVPAGDLCANYFLGMAGSTETPGLTGPGDAAYIGLTDLPTGGPNGPGDHDFQDLSVLVQEVPEPITLALFGTGLAGLGIARRRRPAA